MIKERYSVRLQRLRKAETSRVEQLRLHATQQYGYDERGSTKNE
jgi:hypothetical protein